MEKKEERVESAPARSLVRSAVRDAWDCVVVVRCRVIRGSLSFPSPAREPSCRMSTDYCNFWSSSYTFSFFTCLLQGPSPLPVADMINRRDTSPSLPRVILLIRDATSLAKVHPALAGKLKSSFTWVENNVHACSGLESYNISVNSI